MGNLKNGDVFWCIRPNMESEGYGSCPPVRPWQGKLRIRHEVRTTYELSRFNEETGEVDDDSNATAIISKPEEELFLTLKEALAAYAVAEQSKET